MTESGANDEHAAEAARDAEGSTDPAHASPPDSSGGPSFRIANVLKLALPLVLVGGGAVAFFGFFDGAAWLSSQLSPPLVMATGQIMYQGRPLPGAQIATQHENENLRGSIGWTDDQGRFTLRTDMDGYVDGAFAGQHRVVVTAYELTNVPAAPPLITPRVYASLATSPLRIDIASSADGNEFTLTLEGDPPERSSGGPDGNETAGGGFDPEAIVRRVFDDFDKDDDDKLSSEELQAVEEDEEDRAERIRRADANEDGIVAREELEQALAAPRPSE